MQNRWNDSELEDLKARYSISGFEKNLILQSYATRLLGSESDLTMHGGGNTSLKTSLKSIIGKDQPMLLVKASGCPLDSVTPEKFVGLDLDFLLELQKLKALDDDIMAKEFKLHLLFPHSSLPSIESLMHAFIPFKFVDHSHPSAILSIANRKDGEKLLIECFGDELAIIPYAKMGFDLAKASSQAVIKKPGCRGLVIRHHGLVTWGESAREAYDTTIDLVTQAEMFLAQKHSRSIPVLSDLAISKKHRMYTDLAPAIRGVLSPRKEDTDIPLEKRTLRLLCTEDILQLLNSEQGREILSSPPLTPDYPIRIRIRPLWMNVSEGETAESLHEKLGHEVQTYVKEYRSYLERQNAATADNELLPKVLVIPQIGVICCGKDSHEAEMLCDLTEQAFLIRKDVFESGGSYEGISEEHLFDMQYRAYQLAKVVKTSGDPLSGSIAVVFDAADDMGLAAAKRLLDQGCHTVLLHSSGEQLKNTLRDLKNTYGNKVLIIGINVDEEQSFTDAFRKIVRHWGGIDSLVIFTEENENTYKRIARHLIREGEKVFRKQKTMGDIVLVGKNGKFIEELRKTQSKSPENIHELVVKASSELKDIGVRINVIDSDRNASAEHISNTVHFLVSRQIPNSGTVLKVKSLYRNI
ncbi:MAG: SDR family NAD(P)-dependent oxidoreductase [Chitinispirillaceae bacterium]